MSFHSRKTHIARKPHRCSATGRTIQPGEAYVVFAGKFYGDFYAQKICASLAPIYERINDEMWRTGYEGIAFCELASELAARLKKPTPQSIADAEILAPLLVGLHAKWFAAALAKAKEATK
jgi:hypothetical protein